MMNKHVNRRTLAHAEKAESVAPDKYGNHKHHDSRKAVLNKVLLNDIARQKRITIALGMNDVRGCYNRIVHSTTILVPMSFGVAGEIARAMFKVLQEAEHHMKTGFRRSERAYRNKPVPQQGSGQGNGIGCDTTNVTCNAFCQHNICSFVNLGGAFGNSNPSSLKPLLDKMRKTF